MRNLAVIPARSGSKGLPDKNIRELCGKPLFAYSIDAARKSDCINKVMVSTDSAEYAEIAKKCGAEVPFLRSAGNSSDGATSWSAVCEVLRQYEAIGEVYDTVTLLQPTSPLRTEKDIDKAYRLYEEKRAGMVVSVCREKHSPLWCNTLPEDGCMLDFISREHHKRRQQLRDYYRINGAIYIRKAMEITEENPVYNEKSYAYIMDDTSSIDVDDEMDFEMAEFFLERRK